MTTVEEENVQSYEQWLNSYRQESTRHTYGTAMGSFLRSVYQTDEKTDALATRYIAEARAGKRNCTRDVGDFITYAQTDKVRKSKKPLPPNTLKLYIAVTYGFLSQCCGTEIPISVRRMFNRKMPKGSRARTVEADLDKSTIRKILLHCDVRMKALILFLLSSGIRISEALQLKLDDVVLEAMPSVVHVRGEYAKEGDGYTSFLSSEAKESLVEWLKLRENYVASSAYRVHNVEHRTYRPWQRQPKLPEETAIFPMSYNAAEKAFGIALKQAGLYSKDKETGIASIHLHCFRKFFLSSTKTKIPSEIAETLVGHATYLSDSYRRYTTAQLAEFYRTAENALLVFQDTAQLESLNGEVNKKDRQITDLLAYNMQLQSKLADHESRIARWEAFTKKFMAMTPEQLTEVGNAAAQNLAEQDHAEFEGLFGKAEPVVLSKSRKKRAT
jgi:integrase